MSEKNLKQSLDDAKYDHIYKIINILKQDPLAEISYTNEKKLYNYFKKLTDKNNSLCKGLVFALENYLNK